MIVQIIIYPFFIILLFLIIFLLSTKYVSVTLIPKILLDCLKYREDKGVECCFSISPEEVKFLVTTLALSVCAAARLHADVCSASARVHVPTLVRCTRRPTCTDAVHTATLWPRSVGLRSIAGASESSQPAALSFSVSPNETQLRSLCERRDYHYKR